MHIHRDRCQLRWKYSYLEVLPVIVVFRKAEWSFAHSMRIVVEKGEIRMSQRLENVPKTRVRHRQKTHARVTLK